MMRQLAELFVERAASDLPQRSLRLLVVDACAEEHQAPQLLERLEAISPVRSHLAKSSALDALPEVAHFDLAWLLADAEEGSAYPELLRADLAERLAVPVELVTVSSRGAPACESALAAADLGRCSIWRRRRALAEGALRAAALLDSQRVVAA
jgi:hypothetical protein